MRQCLHAKVSSNEVRACYGGTHSTCNLVEFDSTDEPTPANTCRRSSQGCCEHALGSCCLSLPRQGPLRAAGAKHVTNSHNQLQARSCFAKPGVAWRPQILSALVQATHFLTPRVLAASFVAAAVGFGVGVKLQIVHCGGRDGLISAGSSPAHHG